MKRKHRQVDLEELLGTVEPTMDEVTKPPPTPAISYYDFYKTNGEDTRFYTVGPSMTRQEFAEECDINNLMKRYEGHDIGSIMRAAGEPRYYDFADAPQDLMGFMQMQRDAEAAFMTLPATVRKEFDNDPVAFVEFASDPAHMDQMRSWGLAKPVEAPLAQGADLPPPPAAPPPEPSKASTEASPEKPPK